MTLDRWNRLKPFELVSGALGTYSVAKVVEFAHGPNALDLEPVHDETSADLHPSIHGAVCYQGFEAIEPTEPPAATAGDGLSMLPLGRLFPSPTNPRKRFDEAKLQELASSLKTHGCLQNLTVRPLEAGYEIVAGERRFRAAQLAGLEHLPCIVRSLSDTDVLEIQVIENNQRDDVHPLEECDGFRRLLDSGLYGKGLDAVKALAGKIGKSVRYVYDVLKYRDLCDGARQEFLNGAISAGHATLLARLKAKDQAEGLKHALFSWDVRRESAISVRDLAQWIEREVTLPMAKAPWDLAREDLPGGACRACFKRTCAELDLLEGSPSPDDRCLDKGCYQKKLAAYNQERVDAAMKDRPEAAKVNLNYVVKKEKGLLTREDVEIVKPTDKGARPAVVVEASPYGKEEIGQIVYVRDFRSPAKREQDEAEREAKQKRIDDLRARRQAMVRILTDREGGEIPMWLFRELVKHELDRVWTDRKKLIAKEFAFPKKAGEWPAAIDALSLRDLVALAIWSLCSKDLYPDEWSMTQPSEKLDRCLELAGFDLEAVSMHVDADLLQTSANVPDHESEKEFSHAV
jgi:ParB/RepB/Spo0J family partition protein